MTHHGGFSLSNIIWRIGGSVIFLFWNDVSFVPVRVLHKDEKILGWKHIYLPHAQTAIYDSKVELFLKQGISHQLGRDAYLRGFKVGRYPVLLPVWDRV
jgi:hypothetical protein